MYTYNKKELRYKTEMVNKLLHRGWIRFLKSPVASSIVFTKYRHNEKLRIYINYRT